MAARSFQNQKFFAGSLSGTSWRCIQVRGRGARMAPSTVTVPDTCPSTRLAEFLRLSGTQPRFTSTTRPSGICSGVTIWKPTEPSMVRAARYISRSWRNWPDAAAWRKSSSSSACSDNVPGAGSSIGGALVRAARSAISASFHCRRSTCQVPSPKSTIIAGMVKSVGQSVGWKRTIRWHLSLEAAAAFAGAVPVLQRHHESLGRPKQQKCTAEHHKRQNRHGQPVRQFQAELKKERQRHGDGAENEDQEHSRAVAGIGFGQIEMTDAAALRHLEEAAIELALAAARTTAGKAGLHRRQRGIIAVVHGRDLR